MIPIQMRGAGLLGPIASSNFLTSTSLPSWLTLTRSGHATMFDSAGYLTFAPNNLITYSNTPSNAAWDTSAVSYATGVSDPFGGTNAYTITANSGGAQYYNFISITGAASNTYAVGVWLRRRTGTGIINLFTPEAVPVSKTLTSSWQYFTTSGVGGAGFIYPGIQIVTSGDAVDVYGMTASRVTYETSPRTADQVITTSAIYYGPRFDYDPATLDARGLLIEESRTNVVLWNRDLTNAAWTSSNITAVKDQTGIDGVASSASKITASAGNGTCLQAITLGSSARAQSAWVKRITGTGVVEMTMDNGSTWTAITVTAGWTKVTIPTQTLANPTVGFRIVTSGDAIAVDMVQNENGTFGTSEIPTTTGPVQRAADNFAITGTALTALQGAAGSFVSEVTSLSNLNEGAIVGSNSMATQVGNNVATTWNGSVELSTASGVGNYTAPTRVGVAWSGTTRSLGATGVAVATDSNAFAASAITVAYLGRHTGDTVYLDGHVRRLSFYNVRLSNSALLSQMTVSSYGEFIWPPWLFTRVRYN